MSILVFAESQNNKIKKSSYEAVFYGAKLAEMTGGSCTALVIGQADDAGDLGKYGASKVLNINGVQSFDSQLHARLIAEVATTQGANTIVLSHSSTGKSLLGRLAVRLNAGSVSGANGLPDMSNGFSVPKGVFSGKAIAHVNINTENKILSLMGNSLKPSEIGSAVSVENISADTAGGKITVLETKTSEGTVPLPEAELVVSAGRGMKGPENWGIIDDLANVIGATTACSRPVADTGWRPHHEHVGQTGVAIRPNLYIAIGISGAIQHLAGVNSSKTIVVVNKDPEAPFFKAADYGICADLFDVVPRMIESFKKLKAES